MTSASDPNRRLARFRPLIDHAFREGWAVQHMPGGQLRFMKPGLPTISTGSTSIDDPASYQTETFRPQRRLLAGRSITDGPDGGIHG